MPLPAQRPLFWRWAPEKRVQKELTNICPANKEDVSYALVSNCKQNIRTATVLRLRLYACKSLEQAATEDAAEYIGMLPFVRMTGFRQRKYGSPGGDAAGGKGAAAR
ncbi:MAG: hypothetical protein ACLURV_04360 [Gallintestinimicrobium sp.]